jgi:hypothetical protein
MSVVAIEPVGFHLARLLPDAADDTVRRLEGASRQQAFRRRDVLHARRLHPPRVQHVAALRRGRCAPL